MKIRRSIVLLCVLLLSLGIIRPAYAHGQTVVGDYELEIGFHNEPVIVGQPNGLDLFVTNKKTGEKVNNLENDLQAEVIFGASKHTYKLEPQDGVDGAYTAFIIPTQLGDYTWHIFGKIADTPVDVSMTSAPDTFGSVETASTYLFPAVDPAAAGNNAASSAGQMVTIALVLGGVGVVVGLLGLGIGLAALRTARRQG